MRGSSARLERLAHNQEAESSNLSPVPTFATLRRSSEPELRPISELLEEIIPRAQIRQHLARQLAFCERILQRGAPPG